MGKCNWHNGPKRPPSRTRTDRLLEFLEKGWREIRGRGIGMVFQEPGSSLNPIFTLGHQVAETVRVLQGIGRKAAWNTTLELFHAVQLDQPHRVAGQYPHEISGGM